METPDVVVFLPLLLSPLSFLTATASTTEEGRKGRNNFLPPNFGVCMDGGTTKTFYKKIEIVG